MYPIALSSWLRAQLAELKALNTDPRNFNEQEPIRNAASRTATAEGYEYLTFVFEN